MVLFEIFAVAIIDSFDRNAVSSSSSDYLKKESDLLLESGNLRSLRPAL